MRNAWLRAAIAKKDELKVKGLLCCRALMQIINMQLGTGTRRSRRPC